MFRTTSTVETENTDQETEQKLKKASETTTNIASILSEKPTNLFDVYMKSMKSFEQHVLNNRSISLYRISTDQEA